MLILSSQELTDRNQVTRVGNLTMKLSDYGVSPEKIRQLTVQRRSVNIIGFQDNYLKS